VSPGQKYDVQVKIDPPADSGSVTFEIKGQSGTASLSPTSLTGDGGTLKITGGTQTAENIGPNLTIQATYKGSACGTSAAFAVCAHPSEIDFKYDTILSPFSIQGKNYWGAAYNLTFKSDSEKPGDCDKTKIFEIISISTATGWWHIHSSDTSLDFINTTEPQRDRHDSGGASAAVMKLSMDESGFSGTQVADQLYRFSCARCGIADDKTSGPKVPISGFKITQTMSKDDSGKYFINVKKEGNANNNVSAGKVDDPAVKDAEVKD
jgi:hypothetical protein